MGKVALSILIIFILLACEEVYQIPPQSQVQINFYDFETGETASTPLHIKGQNNDSIWVDGKKVSSYLLPLGNNGRDTFIIMMDSVVDAIIIDYNTNLEYESMATGFYYTYGIKSVEFTNNKIDNITIIDTLVNEKNHENIQIFINDSIYSSIVE